MKNVLFISPIAENIAVPHDHLLTIAKPSQMHFIMPDELTDKKHDEIVSVVKFKPVTWDYNYFHKLAQEISAERIHDKYMLLLLKKDDAHALGHEKGKLRFRDYLLRQLGPAYDEIKFSQRSHNKPLHHVHSVHLRDGVVHRIVNAHHAVIIPEVKPGGFIQGTICYF